MAPDERILRLPDVIARVGIRRSLIYRRIREGTFPRQISLGGRAVGWRESDIRRWLANPGGYRDLPLQR